MLHSLKSADLSSSDSICPNQHCLFPLVSQEDLPGPEQVILGGFGACGEANAWSRGDNGQCQRPPGPQVSLISQILSRFFALSRVNLRSTNVCFSALCKFAFSPLFVELLLAEGAPGYDWLWCRRSCQTTWRPSSTEKTCWGVFDVSLVFSFPFVNPIAGMWPIHDAVFVSAASSMSQMH